MALTLRDILDRLAQLDETQLCDILGISSEDILDRFLDVVEDKIDKLEIEVDWED